MLRPPSRNRSRPGDADGGRGRAGRGRQGRGGRGRGRGRRGVTETTGEVRTCRPLGGISRATAAAPTAPPAAHVDQPQPDAPFLTEDERLVAELVEALEASGGDMADLEADLFGADSDEGLGGDSHVPNQFGARFRVLVRVKRASS